MTTRRIPDDFETMEPVIDAFDHPDAMAALMRLLVGLFPDADVEAAEELAMLMKCVYISGVFAECKARAGCDPDQLSQHLHETWDRIYWMQHNAGEA